MKKKLLLIVLAFSGFQWCYSQIHSHHRMAMSSNRHQQFMNGMSNAINTRNSSSVSRIAKKEIKKLEKHIEKNQKKLALNQEVLDKKVDLPLKKKDKLISTNQLLQKDIDRSKDFTIYWKDRLEEAEKLKKLKKTNRAAK